MMERRHLVRGGMFTGAAALFSTAAPAAAQRDDRDDVAGAIDELTRVFERSVVVSPELARIREQQRIFLKANQKFPDFIDVGIDVWEEVYDWHVRHQLPITATRTADGRYVMPVMFTTLVLRPEQTGSYIGFGFDAR